MEFFVSQEGVVVLGLITFFLTIILGWDRATATATFVGGTKGTIWHLVIQAVCYIALFALAFYFQEMVTTKLNMAYGYTGAIA